jgi:Ni,Fe-hydrogenase III large subunit
VIKNHGDVHSRGRLRKKEINQSTDYIRQLIHNLPERAHEDSRLLIPSPDSFTISLVEGWRGEICHCAITGETGELIHYKIKDPSFHNWLAVALAVRNNEISDFPICNKSFNLSYCGHDL